MFRYAVASILLVVATSAFPMSTEKRAMNFLFLEESPPASSNDVDHINYCKSLSAHDKQILREVKAMDFKLEKDAMNAIKWKSRSLYTRAKVIYDKGIYAFLERLMTVFFPPEGRDFINGMLSNKEDQQLLEELHSENITFGENMLNIVASLKNDGKAEIENMSPVAQPLVKELPTMVELINNRNNLNDEEIKENARAFVAKYMALSEEDKALVEREVPGMAKIVRTVELLLKMRDAFSNVPSWFGLQVNSDRTVDPNSLVFSGLLTGLRIADTYVLPRFFPDA
uniref:Fatty-acid and retinol-binding protein 1 n=1 Tax=Steinernema glaseri TaxID=37863 RepID=A0A1I7ZSG9_9BILA